VDRVAPQLEAIAGGLPTHGNRQLHFHHVVIAHLIAFFNPAVNTLRRMQDVFNSRSVRKRFGLPHVPRSTLSDAHRVFDPAVLRPLITDLARRLPRCRENQELAGLTTDLLAVDGTFFAVAPRVTWALFNKPNGTPRQPRKQGQRGGVRADVHFDILRGVPEAATLCDGRTAEQTVLAENIESGKFYLLDRAFQSYPLLADIVKAGSDFLVRARCDVKFDTVDQRPLTAEDRQSSVIGDREIRLVGESGQRSLGESVLRYVECAAQDPDEEPIRLLTNRLDLPAETLVTLYGYRWQIEIFFRWLKCLAGFQKFLSESEEGMTLQFYSAVIGTLLLALEFEVAPNAYAFSMMQGVMSGLVPLDEALPIIRERTAERARAAARDSTRLPRCTPACAKLIPPTHTPRHHNPPRSRSPNPTK
jgi:hypothetical protein